MSRAAGGDSRFSDDSGQRAPSGHRAGARSALSWCGRDRRERLRSRSWSRRRDFPLACFFGFACQSFLAGFPVARFFLAGFAFLAPLFAFAFFAALDLRARLSFISGSGRRNARRRRFFARSFRGGPVVGAVTSTVMWRPVRLRRFLGGFGRGRFARRRHLLRVLAVTVPAGFSRRRGCRRSFSCGRRRRDGFARRLSRRALGSSRGRQQGDERETENRSSERQAHGWRGKSQGAGRTEHQSAAAALPRTNPSASSRVGKISNIPSRPVISKILSTFSSAQTIASAKPSPIAR